MANIKKKDVKILHKTHCGTSIAKGYSNFANSILKKVMKKLVLAVLLGTLLTSCDKGQNTLSRSEINAKVDSVVALRLQDINNEAMEDLNRREAIEVKPKADSIVAAKMKGKTDTLIHK